jgi:hypothetical protein
MRPLALLPVLLLAACSVPVIHRDLFDAAYSAATGRDCSIVRLDRNESYCRAPEPPPQPPAYCTRSLGTVDCWRDRAALRPDETGVADGPSTLTPAQEANRTQPWPPL